MDETIGLHDSVSLIRINALSQPSYFFTGIHLQGTVLSKYLRPHTDLLGDLFKLLQYREMLSLTPPYYEKSNVKRQLDCYHAAHLFA